MNELIEFLTSKEIIMVYIVVAVACFLYFIIHLIDKYYYKRKQRHNTKELNRLVENINYELSKEREEEIAIIPEAKESNMVYVEPVLEALPSISPTVVEPEVLEEPVVDTIMSEQTIEANEEEFAPQEVVTSEELIDANNDSKVELITSEEEHVAPTELSEESNTQETAELLDYTDAEPNKTEAQEELRKLTEELAQAEQEGPKNIDLTSYEEMQEKEAIISLEELLEKGKKMYENNELTQYADEGNEPICLEDLERKVKESLEEELVEPITTEIEPQPTIEPITEDLTNQNITLPESKLTMDDFYTINAKEARNSATAYKHYTSSPIISPVYGIEKDQSPTALELENTANYEKLDEEIKKTNEFLMTLKDLQKNLD